MAEVDSSLDWTGRLVRLIVVFRTLVLLITIIVLPEHEDTVPIMLAVLVALAVSYSSLRHWERIGPTISRHPAYLAFEVAIATIVLAAAGAQSPFFYYTLGTGALAGVVYGRQGAIPFTALLICGYELVELAGLPSLRPTGNAQATLLAPLLYPLAIGCGIVAREMVQRGVESELTLRERTYALSAEQERLRVARELHDSLAKTVEGLAMSASVLPARCEQNPALAARLARTLAEDARQAALEARMLMADLRPQETTEVSLQAAVEVRAAAFAERAGVDVAITGSTDELGEQLEPAEVHELLRIVSEALTNAATHGRAGQIRLLIDDDGDGLAITVSDDGQGLAERVDFDELKAAGHFGLAGMDERARSIGGELMVDSSPEGGTAVTVRLPSEGGEPDGDVAAARVGGLRRRWRARRATAEPPGVTRTTLRERT